LTIGTASDTFDGMIGEWTFHDPSFAHAPPPQAAWLGHRRFGYDLVRNLRPRRIVELGVCLGTSFFAFCQAVEDGGLDTELVAVDTWQGDEHTGRYGPEFRSRFDEVRSASFPRLAIRPLVTSFDEARGHFPDHTVDVLHIDGCHTYEAARHDYETWAEAVAPGGVILFHDIAERTEGFGVWRLWEELKAQFPTAEFEHSHGLGVLFRARSVPGLDALRDRWRRYEEARAA
jgi:hypothetical protein